MQQFRQFTEKDNGRVIAFNHDDIAAVTIADDGKGTLIVSRAGTHMSVRESYEDVMRWLNEGDGPSECNRHLMLVTVCDKCNLILCAPPDKTCWNCGSVDRTRIESAYRIAEKALRLAAVELIAETQMYDKFTPDKLYDRLIADAKETTSCQHKSR